MGTIIFDLARSDVRLRASLDLLVWNPMRAVRWGEGRSLTLGRVDLKIGLWVGCPVYSVFLGPCFYPLFTPPVSEVALERILVSLAESQGSVAAEDCLR